MDNNTGTDSVMILVFSWSQVDLLAKHISWVTLGPISYKYIMQKRKLSFFQLYAEG